MTPLDRPIVSFIVCAATFAVATGLAAPAPLDPPAGGVDVRKLASELGLSPEALVVAGAASTDLSIVTTILDRLDDAESQAAALASMRQYQSALGIQLTQLLATLRANPEDVETALKLEELNLDITTAQADLDTLRDQLLSNVLDEIPAAVTAKLDVVQTSAGRSVPHELRATQRTPAEWKQIESALRAEKRAERLGLPMDLQHEALLQSVRAEPAVIQAGYELSAKLGSVEAVFAAFETE